MRADDSVAPYLFFLILLFLIFLCTVMRKLGSEALLRCNRLSQFGPAFDILTCVKSKSVHPSILCDATEYSTANCMRSLEI